MKGGAEALAWYQIYPIWYNYRRDRNGFSALIKYLQTNGSDPKFQNGRCGWGRGAKGIDRGWWFVDA